MGNEWVKASSASVPARDSGQALAIVVEHAGPAARFARDEFVDAERRNPHTQKAYCGR